MTKHPELSDEALPPRKRIKLLLANRFNESEPVPAVGWAFELEGLRLVFTHPVFGESQYEGEGWVVTEYSTGHIFCYGADTQRGAIEKARQQIAKNGMKAIKDRIEQILAGAPSA